MTPPGCCQSNISLRKITERCHCISLCGPCLEFLFFWTNSQYQAEAQRPSKLDCFGQVAEISFHWLPCPMSCLSGQIRLQCCALRAVIKKCLFMVRFDDGSEVPQLSCSMVVNNNLLEAEWTTSKVQLRNTFCTKWSPKQIQYHKTGSGTSERKDKI